MVYERGAVNDAKQIARIYLEAFPESIQVFFGKKQQGKLLRLLTNAFTVLLLTGADVMIARDGNQVLGYCIYSSNKGQNRANLVFRNAWKLLILGLNSLLDIHVVELGKLIVNAIMVWLNTKTEQKIPPKCGRINSVAVSPRAQGHGIGKELLKRAFHELSEQNIFLSVRPDNLPAKHLYLNAGFHPVGTTKDLQGKWVMMVRKV